MKKILLSAAFVIAALTGANAQQTISFEASEGFTLGEINEQNYWSLAGTTMQSTNAVIVDNLASDGTNSLRVNTGNTQGSTLIGVFSPIIEQTQTEASVSQDIYVDTFDITSGSDVYIDFFELEGTTLNVTARVIFSYNGNIHVVSGVDGTSLAYETNVATYSDTTWNNLRVTLNGTTLTYFLNDVEFYTNSVYNGTALNVMGYRFDDYSTGFNIDNVVFTDGPTASTIDFVTSTFSVYPNPAKDVINVANSADAIENVTITDMNGRVVKQVVLGVNEGQINISDLSQGVYILNATANGKSVTEKIVKQ